MIQLALFKIFSLFLKELSQLAKKILRRFLFFCMTSDKMYRVIKLYYASLNDIEEFRDYSKTVSKRITVRGFKDLDLLIDKVKGTSLDKLPDAIIFNLDHFALNEVDHSLCKLKTYFVDHMAMMPPFRIALVGKGINVSVTDQMQYQEKNLIFAYSSFNESLIKWFIS